MRVGRESRVLLRIALLKLMCEGRQLRADTILDYQTEFCSKDVLSALDLKSTNSNGTNSAVIHRGNTWDFD